MNRLKLFDEYSPEKALKENVPRVIKLHAEFNLLIAEPVAGEAFKKLQNAMIVQPGKSKEDYQQQISEVQNIIKQNPIQRCC